MMLAYMGVINPAFIGELRRISFSANYKAALIGIGVTAGVLIGSMFFSVMFKFLKSPEKIIALSIGVAGGILAGWTGGLHGFYLTRLFSAFYLKRLNK